jgi:NADPH:quinone reductase-like Zn-dependent oxidoreductase
MKAVAIDELGGRETLRLTDVPEPHLLPDGVRIAIRVAGVNPVVVHAAAGGVGHFAVQIAVALGGNALQRTKRIARRVVSIVEPGALLTV